MTVRAHFHPTLDGARLVRAGDGYVHEDGTPVDPSRLDEIVFVNAGSAPSPKPASAGTGWWRAVDASLPAQSSLITPSGEDSGAREVALEGERLSRDDVSDLLRALADAHEPLAPVEFDPAFFHRTLARWMGLEAAGASAGDAAPVWDYDFWKAELVEEAVQDVGGGDRTRRAFRVDVHRGENDAPERYRYWIELDATGALRGSGWLTEPPDLLGEEKRRPRRFSPAAPDPALVEALLSAAD